MRRRLLASVLLTTAALAGCTPKEPPPPSSQPAPRSAKASGDSASELDRLQALPYAGYSPDPARSNVDGVRVLDPASSYPGYTLVIFHHLSRADLLSPGGEVVHTWRARPSRIWANGEILSNGDFLVVGADPADRAGPHVIPADSRYLLRLSWAGEVVWKRRIAAHHDVEITPAGKILTLTFAERLIPEIDPAVPVRDDRLTLLSPAGRPIETVSLYDVLSGRQSHYSLRRVPANRFAGDPMIDLFHCNSIEWMHDPRLAAESPLYDLGNVLVCSRHQNGVFIINWKQRKLVWSWGRGVLRGPHDATVLSNGHILVFDNGVALNRSRVLEVDPGAGEIVWEYEAPHPSDFYTVSRGSNQRLPNGNTLITDSDHGWVFEVTPDKRIVWEYRCPYKNARGRRATIVRSKRYERDFIEPLLRPRGGADPPTATSRPVP